MKKTIIHIGYPKTATTWFINRFYPKVKNADVIYYNDISFELTNNKEYFTIAFNKEQNKKEQQIVATHIFSGLVNGNWKNGEYRPFFLKHLKCLFPEATIILFIRNQLEFIPSLYSSYLKRGCTFKINKLFNTESVTNNNTIHFEFLNYPKLIRLYQEQFGKENVHVYVYEELLENNKLFLQKYITKYGFDIDINELSFSKSNEKLRSGLASFVRHTNKLISRGPNPKENIINLPFIYSLVNKNIDKLNKFSIWGKKINSDKLLGEKFASEIWEYYKESNNELINNFEIESIKKYGYPL